VKSIISQQTKGFMQNRVFFIVWIKVGTKKLFFQRYLFIYKIKEKEYSNMEENIIKGMD